MQRRGDLFLKEEQEEERHALPLALPCQEGGLPHSLRVAPRAPEGRGRQGGGEAEAAECERREHRGGGAVGGRAGAEEDAVTEAAAGRRLRGFCWATWAVIVKRENPRFVSVTSECENIAIKLQHDLASLLYYGAFHELIHNLWSRRTFKSSDEGHFRYR